MNDWQPRAKNLAEELAASGAISDPRWQQAFEATPRHLFAPSFWALDEYNAPSHIVDGADPEVRTEWLDAVYSDRMLATQWTPGPAGQLMITSSASQPALVAQMLHLLDVNDGDTILEIGTGTGYNTALLCHRLGAEHVVSIDIDPVLVAEATSRLTRLGYQPLVIAGDGGQGVTQQAPYDRILSTCASPGVPPAWIEQLATGGKIVAPFTFGGALAVVTKTGPDEVSGHFDSERAWFMPLRPDRKIPGPDLVDVPADTAQHAVHRGTTEIELAAFDDADFRLWLSMHLPQTHIVGTFTNDFTRQTGVIVHDGAHRARITFPTDVTGQSYTSQDARRLADTIEAAWHSWQRLGCPQRSRIGITARTNGYQHAWLDSPDSHHSWPLPITSAVKWV